MPYMPPIPRRLRPRFEQWADWMLWQWTEGGRRNPAATKPKRQRGPKPELTDDERRLWRGALEFRFVNRRGWTGEGHEDYVERLKARDGWHKL